MKKLLALALLTLSLGACSQPAAPAKQSSQETTTTVKAELYANAAPIIIAPIKLKNPQYNKIVTAFDRRIFF